MAQGDNIGIPISTSTTFAENSDAIAPSQKAVKTAIDTKKATSTGNAYKFETTDASGNLQETTVTASRAVVTDANGLPTASATTATEVGYLTGLQADAVDFIELSYLRSLYNLVYR